MHHSACCGTEAPQQTRQKWVKSGNARTNKPYPDRISVIAETFCTPFLAPYLTGRLSDGNSKVNTQALETLHRLFSVLRDRCAPGLNTLVPALTSNLGSTNEKVRSVAIAATDALIANVDPALLVQVRAARGPGKWPRRLEEKRGGWTRPWCRQPQADIGRLTHSGRLSSETLEGSAQRRESSGRFGGTSGGRGMLR